MIVISLSSISENYYFRQMFENDYDILKFLFDHLTFSEKKNIGGPTKVLIKNHFE